MSRLLLLAATAALLGTLASCAPRPVRPVALDAGGREALYRARLAGGLRPNGMALAEVTLWPRGLAACDTCAPGRLPAVQADLAVLAPAAVRLRVRSAFGTALDVALRGDSLLAYAPGFGWAVALDAARDSFGPPAPGRLAASLLSGVWPPAPGAVAIARSEGLELLWREDGDSVAVLVDETGRPASVRWWRPGEPGVRVRYTRWDGKHGFVWPASWSLENEATGSGLELRVDRVIFPPQPDSGRLLVAIPDGAERVGAGELRRLLGAAGLR